MEIIMKPVAFVRNSRKNLSDDFWGDVVSEIELADHIPTESFNGIESFSHIEIIFHFHLSDKPIIYSRHPRGNPAWPEVGIFAQRNKNRPNSLGLTTVKLISREGRKLIMNHLDAIDGTPVIDIKPVMSTFLPDKNEVREPFWVGEMLKDYWK